MSTWLTSVDIDLDHLPLAVFARFLHLKVSMFWSLFLKHFLGRKSLYPAHIWGGGEFCFTSLRREYLHQLFGALLCRRFVSSPPHMHWFNYLSIWTHSTRCLLWVIMQYYFILLFILVQFWSLGTLTVVSFVPLIILLLNYGFFFKHFLLPSAARCSGDF